MPFIPYNFRAGDELPAITVDKFGRLYLNAVMREKLGIVSGQPFKCHVAFDPDTGNIGIARPGEVNVGDEVSPASFDGKRYYASVRGFISKHGVRLGKYVYIERQNNWYAFRYQADEAAPRRSRKTD
ncbi:hypothetical protein M655_024925 [Brevibacillus sp. NSP2.1]|uniref:hypothetical protein n=1 Tax=Brevibacillus sp. NSP2.1 TaxID=3003229 RepID=UPI00041138AE|nr:hypothetical protein [Brevibacillus sp. NSP2.1]QHZ58615.1 hypothetical protein M655_024925 [Brevibacillus sp. NSP2.1]